MTVQEEGRDRRENHKEGLKMLEVVKSQRLRARVLFMLAAMVVAIMAVSAMTNVSGPLGTKEADAATAYRGIKGTVLWSDNSQPVAYARVNLYWWNGSSWKYWKGVYANSSGQYYFSNNPTGYWYRVQAVSDVYWGWGQSFYLRPDYTIPANSTVYIYYGA